jgi:Asp-tRNA(Asn)/Glu-tRNA(Gln) amidotransferase A subunit family amidase
VPDVLAACTRDLRPLRIAWSPTLPVAAVEAGVAIPPGFGDRNIVTWVCYTYPFNLTGQPAASVPAGFTAGGVPVGLQSVARPYREEDLFNAAAAYEAARPRAARRPRCD